MSTSSAPRVLIMMATYNGERYVVEQLDSILAQKDVEVHVHICDDRSTDDTPAICERYAREHAGVTFVQNRENVGLVRNFMQMVFDASLGDYDYYGFSDQDDIWYPDKLAFSIDWIRSHASAQVPTLFFSDNTNDDGTRQWSETGRFRDCENHPLTLLTFNWLAGCTMLWNHALEELLRAHPLSSYPRGHDSWVHMVARYCGTVTGTYDHATMVRRITSGNAVGSKPRGGALSLETLAHYFRGFFKGDGHFATESVRTLLAFYADQIHPEDRAELESFARYRSSFKARVHYAFSRGFWKPTLRVKITMALGFLRGYY